MLTTRSTDTFGKREISPVKPNIRVHYQNVQNCEFALSKLHKVNHQTITSLVNHFKDVDVETSRKFPTFA